jgi:hypothetical protein
MRGHLTLIVTLLSLACGHAPTSPTLPTSPRSTLEPPAVPSSAMRGEVRDTTNLPISGVQVQVVAPSRHTVAVTDENGQFVQPWPFSGTVTVRASRDGFHVHERPVPEPGAPRRPAFLRFDLEAIDTPIVVAGTYEMTLTAASECTPLPTIARLRTYRVQVYPTSRAGWFTAALFGGDFPYSSFFAGEVRGEPLGTLRLHVVTELDWGNPVTSIVERIGPEMLLAFTGSADLPLGASSATTAFGGTLTVCPAAAAVSNLAPYRCPVQPVTCQSANHRLTWIRQ